jgi:hypothetical protein
LVVLAQKAVRAISFLRMPCIEWSEFEAKNHLQFGFGHRLSVYDVSRQVLNLTRAQLGIRKKKVQCELEVLSW